MKVLMGFSTLKILILLCLVKIYLQEEVEKQTNECLSYIKKSSNQQELFESINKSNFFTKSNFHAIDE